MPNSVRKLIKNGIEYGGIFVQGGWSTDGIALRTEPNGAITIDIQNSQTIYERVFRGCSQITSVTINGSPFIGNAAFENCTGLQSLRADSLQGFRSGNYSEAQSVFAGCSSLRAVVFPAFGSRVIESYNFRNCTNLEVADFNNMSRLGGANVFENDTKLTTLIIRKTDSVPSLLNIDEFKNTPFASGGTGGTLYVPNALISSYQSASNWSTILGYANNSIQAIEGSYYETHYADGTVIT